MPAALDPDQIFYPLHRLLIIQFLKVFRVGFQSVQKGASSGNDTPVIAAATYIRNRLEWVVCKELCELRHRARDVDALRADSLAGSTAYAS